MRHSPMYATLTTLLRLGRQHREPGRTRGSASYAVVCPQCGSAHQMRAGGPESHRMICTGCDHLLVIVTGQARWCTAAAALTRDAFRSAA